MPGTPTPNLALIVPTVGGDLNQWGNELNQNLLTIDGLAVAALSNVNLNFSVPINNQITTLVRVNTGFLVITVSLPAASTCPGKIFIVKKIDAGLGTVIIQPVSGTIDGQNSWLITNQYAFVTVMSNGSTYDVIGGN